MIRKVIFIWRFHFIQKHEMLLERNYWKQNRCGKHLFHSIQCKLWKHSITSFITNANKIEISTNVYHDIWYQPLQKKQCTLPFWPSLLLRTKSQNLQPLHNIYSCINHSRKTYPLPFQSKLPPTLNNSPHNFSRVNSLPYESFNIT